MDPRAIVEGTEGTCTRREERDCEQEGRREGDGLHVEKKDSGFRV